jgi:glycosyltransferase involved in cell wall biosynthesis
MRHTRPIPVLLTVPHLNSTASPYREMMAIVNLLPRSDFRLTVCSLRDGGFRETAPLLESLGIECFVARFRPTGRSAGAIRQSWKDQVLIDRRGPFAIQHSLDFTSSPFEALMARMRSRAYICSQRNLNQNGHPLLLRIKMLLCRRVIAISDAVQRFLLQHGVQEKKVSKIRLGIDVADFGLERTRGYFLCVGQIEPLKRQEDAIRALQLVARDCPEARLGIAGNVFDREYMSFLQRLVAELGVADRVDFLGPRTDILQLMAKASGLIHCSESEAFGWVVVEAMSVGTPVIVAASDGPREIIDSGRTGILLNCGDVSGYAAAMRSLIEEPALAGRFSENGRQEVVRRFSLKTMVDQIRSVYLDCLGEDAAPGALASAASRNL